MTTIIVSSGVTSSGLVVGAGDFVNILSGGAVTAADVQGGGVISVSSGGVVSSSQVEVGGQISGAGEIMGNVYNYGTIADVVIGNGGFLTLESGGATNDLTDGGSIEILSGGSARGTVVSGFNHSIIARILVDEGGSASGTVLQQYASADVYGLTTGTVVSGPYAQENVFSGGESHGARVTFGGGTTGVEFVSSGGMASGLVVMTNGQALVLSGGIANDVVVMSGAQAFVDSGAQAFGLLVSSGGDFLLTPVVSSGVTLSLGSAVQIPGLDATIQNGAKVRVGGSSLVLSGGSMSGAWNLGGWVDDYGVVAGAIVNGVLLVRSGGVANGLIVSAGGTLDVASGGVINGGAVLSGGTLTNWPYTGSPPAMITGTLTVYGGGTLLWANVASGGVDVLLPGAKEMGVTVAPGGVLELSGQSLAVKSGVTSAARVETSTTVISGVTLSSGAALDFLSLAVSSGGTFQVSSGGLAQTVVLASGASATVFAGGTIGRVTVSSGATLSGPGVIGGASTDRGSVYGAALSGALAVSSGGVEEAGTILNGGVETVSSGGVTSDTIVSSGGKLIVASGGHSYATIVSGGGTEILAKGGIADGATVLAGGILSGPGVLTGATEDAGRIVSAVLSGFVTVSSGGGIAGGSMTSAAQITLLSGGTATGVDTPNGGTLIDDGMALFSGGTTNSISATLSGSGTVVVGGTGVLVFAGATSAFAGSLVISGGTAELATAQGIGAGQVGWASTKAPATLRVDAVDTPKAGSIFSCTLSNFEQTYDVLDIRGMAFVAGAKAVLSGSTLVVTDGGNVYSFHLAGVAATTYGATNDGVGGTMIKPTTSNHVVLSQPGFVEAMAAFGVSAAAPQGGYVTSVSTSAAHLVATVGSASLGWLARA